MKAFDLTQLRFDDSGLIPAIVQDAENGQVLMLAYMNQQSLQMTLETGLTHFYSRSRQRIWQKGEESGHIQRVYEIYFDCDEDALLIKVEQVVAACHTGRRSCFFRRLHPSPEASAELTQQQFDPEAVYGGSLAILQQIFDVIKDRQARPQPDSYVSGLFSKGQDQILKKVGEEATELVVASKNGNPEEIIYEAADLWFHALVLLGHHGIAPSEVARELRKRYGKKSKAEYR
ncbi:phosphoribosyl-ATP pyrophosphatase [Candidatus Methylomirabilis lanthanidiphila]|uniref:Histidine biosynthesis bifunctional protein HisIE n=1 Tax=Candidatus Methylomirabilis lanthanidiphila TaxID=2211376 RepID=A0A564ZHH0_9BACT|nr:bifunctional phosphoribosyl-AMP cyclohydrolase/phosphoribosyl-ATP diphosphatase HisIE [Candidatus Methylomirabilis lanthanidiphila]VUZ84112.1 phosphoribosyl-ATP pyrophosphatase [Candidatus Methylomirabilis lanthanidiphila]